MYFFSGDPYDVHATGFLAVCTSLALGCTCRRLAQKVGVGFEMSMLVIYVGAQLKTSVLVRKRWHWVVQTGVGLYMLVLGSTQWHWAVHISVGLYTPSDVWARLGLAWPEQGLTKSKPEPWAAKSRSWPKPWAQAMALST